jgi:thiol-disulfide isomerase/thioredoxin
MGELIQFERIIGSATKLRYLNQRVFGKKPFVVLVYHPQCGHCVQLKDAREGQGQLSAWDRFVKKANKTVFIEVHADMCQNLTRFIMKILKTSTLSAGAERALTSFNDMLNSVAGYPTVMLVNKDMKVTQYEGQRSSEAMTSFLATWKRDI